MNTIKIKLADESIYLTEDGCWFYFESDGADMMKLAAPAIESNYAYSHGGKRYQEALRAIAEWKERHGWGCAP